MKLFNRDARQTGSILAIDGNLTNLSVIGRRLAALDYQVTLSDNGPEALALVAAGGHDLVLLDAALPGMPGLAVLQEIRGHARSTDLPVIMITGRRDAAAAVQMLAAGADDHIAKPFDFDVLAARMARLLARQRRIADLKRSNQALDARIVARAVELAGMQHALDETQADRLRLIASLKALNDEVERLGSN